MGLLKSPTPKADTLKCLWEQTKPQINGDEIRKEQECEAWGKGKEKIEELLNKSPDVDYFGGRCIKTDFSADPVDFSSYIKNCNPSANIQELNARCNPDTIQKNKSPYNLDLDCTQDWKKIEHPKATGGLGAFYADDSTIPVPPERHPPFSF